MSTDDASRWFVSDVECLDDVHALTLVGPDGSAEVVLVDHDDECDGCLLPDTLIKAPKHERLGRLPASVLARVATCEAIARSTRRRCTKVPLPGGRYCGQHAHLEQEAAS